MEKDRELHRHIEAVGALIDPDEMPEAVRAATEEDSSVQEAALQWSHGSNSRATSRANEVGPRTAQRPSL